MTRFSVAERLSYVAESLRDLAQFFGHADKSLSRHVTLSAALEQI